MRPSLSKFVTAGLLLLDVTGAIDLNPDDPASIKSAAKTIAGGLRTWYTGDKPGDVPGNLPDPYYWWLCGAMFGSFVDYWRLTGDETYNAITSQAMVHQIGTPQAFMPQNQTSTLGNDDQAFWGMTAMSAAENKFPDVKDEMSWLSLAIAVYNTQVPRWNTKTCGGGLNWQIFNWNRGFDYKNTISNGAFFNIASRLAKYTGNTTYADWANRAWDWEKSVGLITDNYHFFDGSSERENCTNINQVQWTYNAGIHMSGAAALWNLSQSTGNTQQAAVWKERLTKIIQNTDIFFSQEGAKDVMIEVACERNGKCDHDQRSFKAYLSRWMGWTVMTAPWTREMIMPRLRASAVAAAKQCGGGKNGNTCGLRWWQNKNDGEVGVGEQMAALEVIQNLLVDQTSGPVSQDTGGVSKNDPSAGTNARPGIYFNGITTADKAGAAILTIVVLTGLLAGSWWLIQGE